MKFTVCWTPAAEHDLADMWLKHAAWQSEITQAANEIDEMLRRSPESQGESRFDNVRFLFVPPLAVDYRVWVDDLRVEVLGLTFVP